LNLHKKRISNDSAAVPHQFFKYNTCNPGEVNLVETERNYRVDYIYKGDCRDIIATMPDNSVDVIFADPPYNLQLQQALTRPDMSEVDAVEEDWDRFTDFASYDDFTRGWLTECRRVLKENGTLWVIGTYHNIYRVGAILQDLGFWILNDVVWVKTNPMPNFHGVRFTNAHETLLWCKKSKDQKRYTFNYQSMKTMNDDKQMRSDWELAICTGRERLMLDGQKLHATQKPEALLYRVILSSSNPGDVILDPFFGTGTTGAVARKLGRHFIGIEQEERYITAAQQRIDAIPMLSNGDPQIFGKRLNKRSAPRLTFGSLLEHGMLQPGQTLYFDGQRDKIAIVLADGGIRSADGKRGSVHRIGAHVAGTVGCNGWEHWYYEDESGELVLIVTLREQVRQMQSAQDDYLS
jgi:DNA modification methylase